MPPAEGARRAQQMVGTGGFPAPSEPLEQAAELGNLEAMGSRGKI